MVDSGERKDVPFGPFVLERRVAVGGSAEVFVARPKVGTVPAARFVVKRLLPASPDGDEFNLLEREAELHRAVQHENVVRVFGAGMVGNEPYLAMEYVDGVDLYRLIRHMEAENRRLPAALAVHVVRGVAAALAAVHAARDEDGEPLCIVHRDVTPSNVYLSRHGDVKLGDFGIARVSERARAPSQRAGLKGKFAYLSPEQIAGEPFDHRADLFALAVILGELLIGERIFPGGGQLAVLLAIRDLNIGPLRAKAHTLPSGLFEVCERALSRDPADRYEDAEALSAALAPFELPDGAVLKAQLALAVKGALDPGKLAETLQHRIRDSVQRMRAVQIEAKKQSQPRVAIPPLTDGGAVLVLRRDGRRHEALPFPKLLEWIATGELSAEDSVALMGAEPRPIREIEDLARHLLPSTSATTGQLFEPGVPDYQAQLRETPMLDILARLRRGRETGALFVERRDRTGDIQRKEVYLQDGRLLHVASSDRAELLGEYLIRRGVLQRKQLDDALSVISRGGGRLGDTLISLGFVEAVDVFRAIRDQGRDRVAALCGWPRGTAHFYRGTGPAHVEFPLDLDLASPMMAGAIVASRGEPRSLLPADGVSIEPGMRHDATASPAEMGTVPSSLALVPDVARRRLSVGAALAQITAHRPRGGRSIGEKEAAAALVAARALAWIAV